VHILNVSFLVPTLRREFGGCAGNIAYTLSQLGGEPLVLAAVGSDGQEYLQRLTSWGATTEHVRVIDDSYTAQAIIITDTDNNQITAFHPGAMQSAHMTPVPARATSASPSWRRTGATR
jgi:adenosine kinase